MKLVTTVSMAALVLAPAVGLAMEPSSKSDAAKLGGASQIKIAETQVPYPDWDAVKKTAPPLPKTDAGQQKPGEQNATKADKGEPGLLEKAGQALKTMTGGGATQKEGSSKESPAPAKQGAADQAPSPQDTKAADTNTASPCPMSRTSQQMSNDHAAAGEAKSEPGLVQKAGRAIEAVTGGSAGEQSAAPQKDTGQATPSDAKGGPNLLEKAGRAIEAVTGSSAAKKENPVAADQKPHQKDMKAAENQPYPYPDWPAVKKTAPLSQ